MKKEEKQKVKLIERIQLLENELKTSLHKKTTGKAISVPDYTRKILELKKELSLFK